MNENVHVNGLELGGLNSCFITLRAWKLDGRCTELSVKAHALKGQQCVHRRLVIGDGYVTITEGESIERFFEHAEEAEEEEVFANNLPSCCECGTIYFFSCPLLLILLISPFKIGSYC